MSRPIILMLLAFISGTGIGGTVVFISTNALQSPQLLESAKDRQITELTAALNDLRRQLAADAMVRAEDERRMKAFNVVPTELAKPKTYEIGK